MSYQNERSAIEVYFSLAWGSTTPIGFDGQAFTPVNNSVRLTISDGATLQGTIGGVQNRIDHIGVIQFQIFVEGGVGSGAWRGYAETISALFYGQIVDTSGQIITSPSAAFIRFAPQDQYPYVAGVLTETPFTIATLNAPFARYEYI